MGLVRVDQCVDDDVGDVVVEQLVGDLAAVALTADHAGVLENAQVLADEGLAQA